MVIPYIVRSKLIPSVFCAVTNNNKSEKPIAIPPTNKKEELGKKLKFALMTCDVQSNHYKLNKTYCDTIWDEVDDIAKEHNNKQ